MTEFIEENIQDVEFDLDNIPDSLIYKLPEMEFTYSCEKFGVNEHLHIEYYERMFERAFPGLLQQFPCLYYMVEDLHATASKKTPLEDILAKKNV
jgi:hypothetical protein